MEIWQCSAAHLGTSLPETVNFADSDELPQDKGDKGTGRIATYIFCTLFVLFVWLVSQQ